MDMLAYLEKIGAPQHHLTMRELRPLSDIDPRQYADFHAGWFALLPDRRHEIVVAMVELAEENIDLHFQQAFLWITEDDNIQTRTEAINGLWEAEQPRVMRRLLDILKHDTAQDARAAAATVLSRFAYLAEMGELNEDDSQQLFEYLLSMARDSSQPLELRRRSLESISYYASMPELEQQIEHAYESSEIEMKESALMAMGRSMLPRWLPILRHEVESRSPALRYEAARAAGEMGEDAHTLVMAVVKLLGDSDTEVALAAIWALGQIGGDTAKRALEQVRDRSESEARLQAANDALAEISLDAGVFSAKKPTRSS